MQTQYDMEILNALQLIVRNDILKAEDAHVMARINRLIRGPRIQRRKGRR